MQDDGYSIEAAAQLDELRGIASDVRWRALKTLLSEIFDNPDDARLLSQPLHGARGQSVWKVNFPVPGEEPITVMWRFDSGEPLVVWMGVWPPA